MASTAPSPFRTLGVGKAQLEAYELGEAQLDIAEKLASRYVNPAGSCKAFQDAWRLKQKRKAEGRAEAALRPSDSLQDFGSDDIYKRDVTDIASGDDLSRNVSKEPGDYPRYEIEAVASGTNTRRSSKEATSGSLADGSESESPKRGSGNRERHDSTELSEGTPDDFEAHAAAWDDPKMALLRSETRAFEPKLLNFQTCVVLAKKHCLPVDHVRDEMERFTKFGPNSEGLLEMDKFKDALRIISGVAVGEDIPEHLISKNFFEMDADANGGVDFEEFLIWHLSAGYTEEMMVEDANDRVLRQISRDNGIPLPDVERIKKAFIKYDTDNSGAIDQAEFRHVVTMLMKVKDPSHVSQRMFGRLWREVDKDGSGTISFEEFATWYYFLFYDG